MILAIFLINFINIIIGKINKIQRIFEMRFLKNRMPTDIEPEIPKKCRHLEPPWSSIWGLSGVARSSAFNNCIPCNLSVILNTLEKPRLMQADCVHLRVHVDCVIIAYFFGMNPIAPKLNSMVVQRSEWGGIGSLVSPARYLCVCPILLKFEN